MIAKPKINDHLYVTSADGIQAIRFGAHFHPGDDGSPQLDPGDDGSPRLAAGKHGSWRF
jgi:hypothetical protein